MTRAVSGFCGEAIHCASASRRPEVRPSGRGISVGGLPWVATCDEARLHLRAVAFDVAANQEVRRRHFVPCRTLVQIAAGERRRDPALRAADDLVAFAERREPVVAVGDDLGHRQRLRPLFLERRDLRVQLVLLAPSSSGGMTLSISRPATLTASNTWSRAASRPASARLRVSRPLDRCVGEQLLDLCELQPFAMRLLDRVDLAAAARRSFAFDSGVLRQVGLGFGGRRQRHLGLDVAEDRRLQRVVVLLPDRIELVIVAARAVDRQTRACPCRSCRESRRGSRSAAPGCPSRGTARAARRAGIRWRSGCRRSCRPFRRRRSARSGNGRRACRR